MLPLRQSEALLAKSAVARLVGGQSGVSRSRSQSHTLLAQSIRASTTCRCYTHSYACGFYVAGFTCSRCAALCTWDSNGLWSRLSASNRQSRFDQMSAHGIVEVGTHESHGQGQPQGAQAHEPASPIRRPKATGPHPKPTGLRARLRAARTAAQETSTAAAAESASTARGKRGRDDNDSLEPAPSTTDSSKRVATEGRRARAKRPSAAACERRRRMSSADYSEDVEEVDERIDYVEEVEDEDEDEETGATPHPIRRRTRRPRRGTVGDASAFESKSSLANRFGGIKWGD